jgi:hypothetical protein
MIAPNTSFASPIQYRSGLLEQWIGEYARNWGLSTNESAKRLAALAATGLGPDQYGMLATLSQAIAGPSSRLDFVKACHQVKIALDAANLARQQIGVKPMDGEERARFIEKTIQEMTSKRQQIQAELAS